MTQPGIYPDVILKIIEEFTDGFLILDCDGDLVFSNDAFLKLTGWRGDELRARHEEILRGLDGPAAGGERAAELLTRWGVRLFHVASFVVDGDRGSSRLLRVKQMPDPAGRRDYDLLFNNTGDALVSVDLSGRVTAANPSYYRLIASTREAAPRSLPDLYLNRREFDDRIMKLTSVGALYNIESHIKGTDGQIRHVVETSWANRSETGVITGYTCQLHDVTYLRNLEQRLEISERNYLLLFDTILSSIVIVDPEGRVLNWNYGAEQMYGHKWDDVVGRGFDEIFGVAADRPALPSIMATIGGNGGRFVETGVPRTCRDGTVRFVYAAYAELRNSLNELLGYSIMERDLTDSVRLEQRLKESYEQLKQTQSATIKGWAQLTEYRDKETGRHLTRISDYTRVLASHLRENPRYSGYITDGYIEDLCLSAVLHDIGKVAVSDSILLKKGRLDPEEYARMKEHARIGGDALSAVEREIKRESFLTLGKEIAYHHHEWWNGSGYPDGSKGEEIPLSARIVALADVYDALTTERPYKKAFSHDQAVAMIQEERGTHFDPDLVDVFVQQAETFHRIKIFNEFEDNPESISDLLDHRKAKESPHSGG